MTRTLIPFCVQKIISIEKNIYNTRKGINRLIRVFKSSERSENDGLQPNFKMNKSELELRNLVDLAFIIQDYETTYANAGMPSDDFKRHKVFLHGAHCDEIKLLARIAHER